MRGWNTQGEWKLRQKRESWGRSTLNDCRERIVAGGEVGGKQGVWCHRSWTEECISGQGSDQQILLSSQVRSFSLFQIFGCTFLLYILCINSLCSLLLSVYLLSSHSEWVYSEFGRWWILSSELIFVLSVKWAQVRMRNLSNYLNLFASHVDMEKAGVVTDTSVSFYPGPVKVVQVCLTKQLFLDSVFSSLF